MSRYTNGSWNDPRFINPSQPQQPPQPQYDPNYPPPHYPTSHSPNPNYYPVGPPIGHPNGIVVQDYAPSGYPPPHNDYSLPPQIPMSTSNRDYQPHYDYPPQGVSVAGSGRGYPPQPIPAPSRGPPPPGHLPPYTPISTVSTHYPPTAPPYGSVPPRSVQGYGTEGHFIPVSAPQTIVHAPHPAAANAHAYTGPQTVPSTAGGPYKRHNGEITGSINGPTEKRTDRYGNTANSNSNSNSNPHKETRDDDRYKRTTPASGSTTSSRINHAALTDSSASFSTQKMNSSSPSETLDAQKALREKYLRRMGLLAEGGKEGLSNSVAISSTKSSALGGPPSTSLIDALSSAARPRAEAAVEKLPTIRVCQFNIDQLCARYSIRTNVLEELKSVFLQSLTQKTAAANRGVNENDPSKGKGESGENANPNPIHVLQSSDFLLTQKNFNNPPKSGKQSLKIDDILSQLQSQRFTLSNFDLDLANPANKAMAARILTDVNADVLCLSEVESLKVLDYFNSNYLPHLGYNQSFLVESRDRGASNVAILSRYPIVSTHSHKDAVTRDIALLHIASLLCESRHTTPLFITDHMFLVDNHALYLPIKRQLFSETIATSNNAQTSLRP